MPIRTLTLFCCLAALAFPAVLRGAEPKSSAIPGQAPSSLHDDVFGNGTSSFPWPAGTEGWRAHALPAWKEAHTEFIPVPEPLASCHGGLAVLEGGKSLPLHPVIVENRLVGVEVELPAGGKPFWVYPTRTATSEPGGRKPMTAQLWNASLTTRPYEYIEMERFLGALPAGDEMLNSAAFDAEELRQQPGLAVRWGNIHTEHNKHKTQIVHLSTYLLRDPEKPAVQLAAANGEAPFFLYLNGQPVLKWKPGSAAKAVATPKPIPLSQPLVRLDFFTLVQSGERFPVPLVYNAETRQTLPLTATQAVASVTPRQLSWERQGDATVFAYDAEKAMLWLGHPELGPVLFLPGGMSAGRGPACRAVAGSMISSAESAGVKFAMAWQPALRYQREWPELVLDKNPLAFSGKNLDLNLQVAIPESLEKFRRHLAVRQERRLKNGRTVVSDQSLSPLPARAETTLPAPGKGPRSETLSVSIEASDLQSFRLFLAVDGIPFSLPLEMMVLEPEASFADLSLVNGRIVSGGQAAVVFHADASLPPPTPPRIWTRKPAWYDEFWFQRRVPGADLTPASSASKNAPAGHKPLRLFAACHDLASVAEAQNAGTARFLALAKIPQDANIVFWSLDPGDTASYQEINEYAETCRFLGLACLAQGRLPVFITAAALPGKNPESMQLAALRLKQLGFELNVPVIDLYSIYRLQTPNQPFLANPYAGEHPGLQLPSPNNLMRQWLLEQVAEKVEQAL